MFKKDLGATIAFEELETVLHEIELTLNNQPIIFVCEKLEKSF